MKSMATRKKSSGTASRSVSVAGAGVPQYIYTVKIHPADADEGGFWAEVPALPGCNTQGETYEETLGNAKQAIEGYLKMLIKLGEPIPVERQPRRIITTAVKVAV